MKPDPHTSPSPIKLGCRQTREDQRNPSLTNLIAPYKVICGLLTWKCHLALRPPCRLLLSCHSNRIQMVLLSTHATQEGEAPSIPDTPHFYPDQGDPSPEEPASGIATRIAAKEHMTPPLLSRLIQGYLDHTGIEACPYHQMDHGVRDPVCDHCKRALGPLYHHKIAGNRHLPVFTFDFSGPHPHRVNVAQYLLVSVWSLGHMRLIWAFGVESLQSCFEDLRTLTGGSRPPILRLHSDKASEFLTPTIGAYWSYAQMGCICAYPPSHRGPDKQGPTTIVQSTVAPATRLFWLD